jgi:hypothetical protein
MITPLLPYRLCFPSRGAGRPGHPAGAALLFQVRRLGAHPSQFGSTSMAAASHLLSFFLLLLLPASNAIYCDEDDCYDLLGYHLPPLPLHLTGSLSRSAIDVPQA